MSTVTRCGASRMLRGITWSSLVCACLSAAVPGASDAKGTDRDSLRSDEIERLRGSYRGDRPLGAVVFHCQDERGTALDSIDICPFFSGERHTGSRDSRRTDWLAPKAYSYDLVCPRYRTVQLRDILIPADTLVLITVKMAPGTDSVTSEEALSKCVEIKRSGLDVAVPRNAIVGAVYDEGAKVPVEDANVFCETLMLRTTTDSLGRFTLPLDTLRRITLHVWHPAYDSIKFDVDKQLFRTEKNVAVRFESRRDTVKTGRPGFSDSSALLLVSAYTWSSWGPQNHEENLTVSTFAVKAGEVFGPTSSWNMSDCLPYRLIRTFPNRQAWVQFAGNLCLAGTSLKDRSNLLTATDSPAALNTRTHDGGMTVALQLMPDYAPRGVVEPKKRGRATQSTDSSAVDTCALMKADVERTHLRNVLYFIERDFDSFVEAFSPAYHGSVDHFEPTAENWRRLFAQENVPPQAPHRLSELYRIQRSEIYIYDRCNEPPYEPYLTQMKRAGLTPSPGDVYISFPAAPGSPMPSDFACIYRLYDGRWKIITWGR